MKTSVIADIAIRHLNIEVTKRCNQRCFYCFNNSGVGDIKTELDAPKWLRIIKALQERGLQSIHLTGGEPFSYKGAVDILAGAQAIGVGTSILSNGLRVKELVVKHTAAFRALTVAQFSLDSMDPEKHNRRRGYANAWRDAMAAIEALRALEVPVEISSVVSEDNLQDLSELGVFAKSISAALIVRPILHAGRATALKESLTFDTELADGIGLLQNCGATVTADRFHYVTEQNEVSWSIRPLDCHTAFHTGMVLLPNRSTLDLNAVAA